MRWTDCRIVAFDTETTGLGPFEGDRVIEFGGVELRVGRDGRVIDVRDHNWLINPEIPIPRSASKISGITDEDVAKCPTFDKLADKICAVLQDAIVVAHNLSFDQNFITAELGRLGKHWPRTRAEVDTLPLSQRLLTELSSHRLEVIAGALGVPLDTAHRASHDAEACGRVLVELARRHEAPPEFDGFIEWADAISPPPDTGHLRNTADALAVFCDGPHAGQSVARHPDYLQWMQMALERRDGRWIHRYPESVRLWAARWLRVRGSSQSRQSPRSQGAQDWTLDPPTWLVQA